jgi:hypothetical protein
MKNILAFADEYGNNSFDFDNQGTHFIVASIILSSDNKEQCETQAEEIRKRHFQTGEIKSSKVGSNDTRRITVLNDLAALNFQIYAVIVDKRQLFGEGFKYKKSFYKFLNGLVYNELFKTFPKLHITVDEHGGNDFMIGFKKYVQKQHIPDLFFGSEFRFEGSPNSVLIQVADFIAGTLGRCYDELKKSARHKEFLEILKPKITSLNFFPQEVRNLDYEPEKDDKIYNRTIAELSYNLANNFLDKNKGISQEEKDQINCLKLLLLYFKAFDYKKYVSTKEIINHLRVDREKPINEQYFRSKVVAKLRDEGLIIASKSSGDKKGYKLPTSVEDLYYFVNHGNSMIIPMLARIKRCRDTIKLATQNETDILEKPEYQHLRSILDVWNEQ